MTAEPGFEHNPRHLDPEMGEAMAKAAEFIGLEHNPLRVILYRLDHTDKQIESIRIHVDGMGDKLNDHIAKSDEIKEAIDDLVVIWRGSRVMGRIIMWFVGTTASAAALWAAIKKWPI